MIGGVIVLCIIAGIALYAYGSHLTGGGSTTTGSVIYKDSMTDSPAGWTNSGSCTEQSDGYHITGAEVCYAPKDQTGTPSDVTVSVTVRAVTVASGGSYGIAVRRPSPGNFYAFEITADGQWVFYKAVSGGNSTIIQDFTSNSAIHTGQTATNVLKITAKGSTFTFYANGTQLGQASDSSYTSGQVGVDGADNSEVVYTNFEVDKA